MACGWRDCLGGGSWIAVVLFKRNLRRILADKIICLRLCSSGSYLGLIINLNEQKTTYMQLFFKLHFDVHKWFCCLSGICVQACVNFAWTSWTMWSGGNWQTYRRCSEAAARLIPSYFLPFRLNVGHGFVVRPTLRQRLPGCVFVFVCQSPVESSE